MSLDPGILQALAHAGPPPPPDIAIAAARAHIDEASDRMAAAATEPGPALARVQDHHVPVEDGEIVVRLYTTPGGGEPAPGHLLLHSGSFFQGTAYGIAVDATARERCVHAGVVVASVEYRLAPEHPYPTALQDCYAAWCWLHDHGPTIGVDPQSLSIGGQSAGANLAAGVTLLARAHDGPPAVLQLLEVPALDLTWSNLDRIGIPEVDDVSALAELTQLYLPDPDLAGTSLASPLLEPDLSDLPPAHIMTAEHDPLRAQGEAYARRLAAAGVRATVRRHTGHVHPSSMFTALFPGARRWRAEVLEVLRTAHRTSSADEPSGLS